MKKFKYLIVIIVISLIVTFGITYSFNNKLNEYSDDNISILYDSSFKVIKDDSLLSLEHRKSKSKVKVYSKELSSNYIDTDLSNLIRVIESNIELQNKDYKLIKVMDKPSTSYQSYAYLYEKGMEQVLVSVYKKDSKLILIYYEADSHYYDIVLDSVENILNSLIIK